MKIKKNRIYKMLASSTKITKPTDLKVGDVVRNVDGVKGTVSDVDYSEGEFSLKEYPHDDFFLLPSEKWTIVKKVRR